MASKELMDDIAKFTFKYCGGSEHVEEFLTEFRMIIERAITEATDYMIHGPAAGNRDTEKEIN